MPTGQPCGAVVTDIDLSGPLSPEESAALRAGLDDHHVLVFPDQVMTNDELERFSQSFGELGIDPWFVPIEGSRHIAEIRRDADETSQLFGEGWHSDWSFLDTPPIATCLYGIDIPPVGGDTLFANQHLAYERLPDELRARVDGLRAVHSDRHIYGKGGKHHPDNEAEQGRSMTILADRDPYDGEHPLVRVHEGNGRRAFFSTAGYVQGIVGMDDDEATALIREVYRHQTADEVIYRHTWQPNMAVVWDNRSVLHRATGGYEGHSRLLRRTTILPVAA
ncbi:MAG: TauD/TfdA family dioxygenase [Actinomycetota bacterium]